jgi:lysophospholipid acyltransferase
MWSGLQTIFISAAGAYAIASKINSPFMPWIGFVFLMGHMSMNHIIRQSVNDPSAVDISGAQMVMVMKLTAFCWNVQDGRLPDAELSEFQKEHAVRTMPSILDYAGYVLFFPSFMAGPAFDYCDYSQYITTTMFTLPPGTDPKKAPATRKKRKIPRSGTPAAIKAAYGTLWIFAFLKYGILRRVWQLYMLGLTTRMKYYGVWSLSEGACILSGIGYNGIDPKSGRAKWDRLTNIKPIEIETAQNTRAFLGFWNINTNLWLRNYMYLRVTPKGQKPGFQATLATFVTSAFWHGFYPGYYMAFILASFLQTIAKSEYPCSTLCKNTLTVLDARRMIRPLFLTTDGKSDLPSKKYYDVFTTILTQATFAFTVAPFILLDFSDTVKVWSRVYFYVLVGVAASFALFSRSLPFRKQLTQRQAARVAPAATADIDASSVEKAAREEMNKISRVNSEASTASSRKAPTLGISDDPEAEIAEIIAGVNKEIAERRRRGSMLQGFNVKQAVQQKMKEFTSRDGRSA